MVFGFSVLVNKIIMKVIFFNNILSKYINLEMIIFNLVPITMNLLFNFL